MKKTFKLTNKYLILLTPLLLYSLISSVYLASAAIGGKMINILIALLLFVLMTVAFVAGWFYMIKLVVSEPEIDDANSLIKEFPSGVGEYFLPSLGLVVNIIIFSIIMLVFAFNIGAHFIGEIGISADSYLKALESSEAFKAFIASLDKVQLVKISNWNTLLLCTMVLTYFMTLLYPPAIFFKEKNPYKAIIVFLKDLFSKNFFKTLGVYLIIFLGNFVISIFSAFFSAQAFMHFFLTLLNFYFVTLVGVGVFNYYYTNFVKPLLGQNIDVEV